MARGHIYQTPNGYRAQVDSDPDPVTGKRRQVRIGPFRTKKEAETAVAQVTARRAQGFAPASGMKVSEFIEDVWLPNRRRKGLSATTISGYEYQAAHIIRHLGNIRLADLNSARIERFVAEFSAELSARGTPRKPGSVKAVFTALRAALNLARKLGYLPRNAALDVADSLPAIIRDRNEVDWWNPDQIRTFLDFVRYDRLIALWRIYCLYGPRRSEAAGLKWTDIDWDAGTVLIQRGRVHIASGPITQERTKEEASYRLLHLDPETLESFRLHQLNQEIERERFGTRWNGDGFIFTGVKTGAPIRPDYIYTRFISLGRKAGLPKISVHDVRRSFITAARDAEVSSDVTADLVGHSSDRTTKDYYYRDVPRLRTQASRDIVAHILGDPEIDDAGRIDDDENDDGDA